MKSFFAAAVVGFFAWSSLATVLYLDPALIRWRPSADQRWYHCDYQNMALFLIPNDLIISATNLVLAAKQRGKALYYDFDEVITFESKEQLKKYLTISHKTPRQFEEDLESSKEEGQWQQQVRKKKTVNRRNKNYIKDMSPDDVTLSKTFPSKYWLTLSPDKKNKYAIDRSTYKRLKQSRTAAKITGNHMQINFKDFFSNFNVEIVSSVPDETSPE
ncbi:MAG TPA: hypothetical protein VEL47_04510 [Myxococcota bacterium]|nr:hypothetical protein [Myxococcota bacterium]